MNSSPNPPLRHQHWVLHAIMWAVLWLAVPVAAADSSRDFGKHIVHCKAISSTALDAETATQLGIDRARNLGMINIAVMEKTDDDAMGKATRGRITAHWSDLSGMMGTIVVREVRDQDAIFYIGEFELTASALVTFDILISIDDSRPPYRLTFNKQFSDG